MESRFLSLKETGFSTKHTFLQPWIALYPYEDENYYPGVTFKFLDKAKGANILAQRIKIGNDFAHALGIDIYDDNYYLPNKYDFFSVQINIVDRKDFESVSRDIKAGDFPRTSVSRKHEHIKVLLLNLPWQRDVRWGVRAGSRWPHIKDEREEGNYLPYPFFLAYSASLLRKHGFMADLVDAIAEKITEDKLIGVINRLTILLTDKQ